MAGSDWSKVVEIAVGRFAANSGSAEFALQDLIRAELPRIVRETGSRGATPEATLRRELQQLRDQGVIEFLGQGRYRLTTPPALFPLSKSSNCVFMVGLQSSNVEEQDRFYHFGKHWLDAALRAVGQWILYQDRAGQRGYYATAKIEQVIRDPLDAGSYLALIEPGSFLEFGSDVGFEIEDLAIVRDLQLIRPISDEDFDRIVSLGLVDASELLPRFDTDVPPQDVVREAIWLSPIERETALVSRKVRDRQFRKRVLEAYKFRCAITGMHLTDSGGSVETQAAHIMGVEHGGPDWVDNGIALCGTAHWMFDHGLVSLSDSGEILLSSKINDVEGVEKLIDLDRRAGLPTNEQLHPHARFLAWHREYHRFEV